MSKFLFQEDSFLDGQVRHDPSEQPDDLRDRGLVYVFGPDVLLGFLFFPPWFFFPPLGFLDPFPLHLGLRFKRDYGGKKREFIDLAFPKWQRENE